MCARRFPTKARCSSTSRTSPRSSRCSRSSAPNRRSAGALHLDWGGKGVAAAVKPPWAPALDQSGQLNLALTKGRFDKIDLSEIKLGGRLWAGLCAIERTPARHRPDEFHRQSRDQGRQGAAQGHQPRAGRSHRAHRLSDSADRPRPPDAADPARRAHRGQYQRDQSRSRQTARQLRPGLAGQRHDHRQSRQRRHAAPAASGI